MRSAALVALVALAVIGLAVLPTAASAKACSAYPNQAAAQRAADTRDADGDGIYCESLPCPCSTGSKPSGGSDGGGHKKKKEPGCSKPSTVVSLYFSAAKYPHIHQHFRRAVRKGWPRILKLHRRKAGVRRDRALEGFPTRKGYDRDEYPPAVGRATWRTDIAYVPSHENRSHGSSLGGQLRPYCTGTRFKYVFN